MESMNLSPRLQAASELIPIAARLADVGTDHGKLPISLIIRGKIKSAIASDIRIGPLDHAIRNAEDYGITDRVSFRLGNGLEKILPTECDTITILGMGGETIAEILEAALWTLEGNHLIILQAMTMLPFLRIWLAKNGFYILHEQICREENKYYTVIAARGSGVPMACKSEDSFFSTPLLTDPLAKEYLSYLLAREERVMEGLVRGKAVTSDQLNLQHCIIENLKKTLEGLS